MFNFSNKKFFYLFALINFFFLPFLIISKSSFAGSEWDGKYNANFKFQMSRASVCPKTLPIDVEIIVTNGQAEGFIFNNGGGNKHEFCKLYHNGTITGNIKKNGDVNFKINQNDSHAKKYSSYKIKGNVEGELKLISHSYKYHPPHKFQLTRIAD
tara:strand:- start:120 stop:584 length:465 start_codon:yes stop_codon:yes gene_type:complete